MKPEITQAQWDAAKRGQAGSHFRMALGALLQKEEDEVKTDQGSWLCFGPRPLQKEEGELKTNVEGQHIKTMMHMEHKQLQSASAKGEALLS
jgi:hypothetical protein